MTWLWILFPNSGPQLENIPWWGKNILTGGANIRLEGKFTKYKIYNNSGLGPHLFVKVPRPGDSEVTFSVFANIRLEGKFTKYKIYNNSENFRGRGP